MTVVPGDQNAVATYNPDDWNVGMEDVGASDVVIPRLNIVHAEAVFQNNLTKEKFQTLDVIVLGLIKQRIMWDDVVDEGDKPMCKSPDFEHGFPNVNPATPEKKRFPWHESNFDPANFPAAQGINNLVTLPCDSCVFKEWGADKTPPPCTEQHTYSLLYDAAGDNEEPRMVPALLTLQRTGIKPSRAFISGFSQSRSPFFSAYTRISLTAQKRGSVIYSVPTLSKVGVTDAREWQGYSEQAKGIREIIRSAPRAGDDAPVQPSDNTNTAPTPAAPAPAAPPAAPAAAPVAAPVQQAPEAGTSAPVAPAPAPAAPVTPAAPPVDDDLPF